MNGDRFYGIQKRYSLHASIRVARACVRVRDSTQEEMRKRRKVELRKP